MPGSDQNPKSMFRDDEEGKKQAELLDKLLRDIPAYEPDLFEKNERKGPEEKHAP